MFEMFKNADTWVVLMTQAALLFFSFQFGWSARVYVEARAKRAQQRRGAGAREARGENNDG